MPKQSDRPVQTNAMLAEYLLKKETKYRFYNDCGYLLKLLMITGW